MIYTSIEFIFFAAFVLYFVMVAPRILKVATLGIAGLFWYSAWSLQWLGLLLGIFCINYLGLWFSQRAKLSVRNKAFTTLLSFNVLIFIFLKSASYWFPQFSTPYGISFFMLMLIGVIIDVWRDPQAEKTRPDFLMTMLFFFPVLIGGPIERAKNLFPQFERLKPQWDDIAEGIIIFSYGFSKRLLVAVPLTAAVEALYDAEKFNLASLAMAAAISTFQAYVDFSSYCDMGRGVARSFGIRISFNFRPIYFARNPNDYWQRWNISIGTWMRDYFTMPLLLRFGRKVPAALLLFFSFILIGLWHGLTFNWLLFGIFNGAMITIYARSQFWFRKSRRYLTITGFLLVALTFIGNGFFQRQDFRSIWEQAVNHPATENIVFTSNLWLTALIALAPFILTLFIVEYFQERTKDLDFYLKMNIHLKRLLAVTLTFSFLVLLHFSILGERSYDLPLYFRF